LNWVTAGASVNASAALQFGIIDAKLQLAAAVNAQLQAGINAPGLSLWSYNGAASRFGTRLESHTNFGWPGVPSTAQVLGVVIATEDFDSWGSFSLGFNTGGTSKKRAQTSQANLRFLGTLGGGQLNTGVLSISATIQLILLELQGLAAALSL